MLSSERCQILTLKRLCEQPKINIGLGEKNGFGPFFFNLLYECSQRGQNTTLAAHRCYMADLSPKFFYQFLSENDAECQWNIMCLCISTSDYKGHEVSSVIFINTTHNELIHPTQHTLCEDMWPEQNESMSNNLLLFKYDISDYHICKPYKAQNRPSLSGQLEDYLRIILSFNVLKSLDFKTLLMVELVYTWQQEGKP